MNLFNSAVTFLQNHHSIHPAFFSFRDLPSRQQAIEEGYLVDVSSISKTFNVPVAMTREVWENCVVVKQADAFREGFRTISILMQAKIAIKQAPADVTEVSFDVKQFPWNTRSHKNKQRLWVAVSLGDKHEPVLTVMLDSQHE